MQQQKRHVVADDRRILQDPLFGARQRIDTRRENRLHGWRDFDLGELLYQTILAAAALQGLGVYQRAHDLFDEKRIPAGAAEDEVFQRGKAGIGAEHGLKEL